LRGLKNISIGEQVYQGKYLRWNIRKIRKKIDLTNRDKNPDEVFYKKWLIPIEAENLDYTPNGFKLHIFFQLSDGTVAPRSPPEYEIFDDGICYVGASSDPHTGGYFFPGDVEYTEHYQIQAGYVNEDEIRGLYIAYLDYYHFELFSRKERTPIRIFFINTIKQGGSYLSGELYSLKITPDAFREGTWYIPLISAKIVGDIKFFESGGGVPQKEQRVYNRRFSKTKSRYIYSEINLTHPYPPEVVNFAIEVIYYNPDGSVLGQVTNNTYVQPGWNNSNHVNPAWGWSEPGNWKPGTYKVEFYVQGEIVASESFEIY